MFRIVTGTLKSDSTVCNRSRGTTERVGSLQLLQGKTPTAVPEPKSGDLGTVAKLRTRTNDTLGDKPEGVTFAAMKFPEPVLSYAIEPRSRGDEDKINQAMHRLEEEDPTIRWQSRSADQGNCCCHQGQIHIEVTVAKLKRRFGVDVLLKPPHPPSRDDQGVH